MGSTRKIKMIGQKGGKSGGGAFSLPEEDPNNLKSKSTARIIDLVSEGPIVGLVNGSESVFYDGTPLKNGDPGAFILFTPGHVLPSSIRYSLKSRSATAVHVISKA